MTTTLSPMARRDANHLMQGLTGRRERHFGTSPSQRKKTTTTNSRLSPLTTRCKIRSTRNECERQRRSDESFPLLEPPSSCRPALPSQLVRSLSLHSSDSRPTPLRVGIPNQLTNEADRNLLCRHRLPAISPLSPSCISTVISQQIRAD